MYRKYSESRRLDRTGDVILKNTVTERIKKKKKREWSLALDS